MKKQNRFLNTTTYPEHYTQIKGLEVHHGVPKRMYDLLHWGRLDKAASVHQEEIAKFFSKKSDNFNGNHVDWTMERLVRLKAFTYRGEGRYQVNLVTVKTLRKKFSDIAKAYGYQDSVRS